MEEEELQFIAGNETPSEEPHPDDKEGDDLSVITIDSLKDLDSQKVREIWTGMAEIKEKERDYYNQLAAMVDDMTPNDIYATIQVTPRPGTTAPQCADDLLEEVGNEEIFRRILGSRLHGLAEIRGQQNEKEAHSLQAKHHPRGRGEV